MYLVSVKEKKQENVEEEEEEQEQEEDDGVAYDKLRPTYTHECLVKLMTDNRLKYCISQNGDGLHMLSGMEVIVIA